jgi:hypothetical protein
VNHAQHAAPLLPLLKCIVNHAQHAAPLLPLLKKGERWKSTGELQVAFERLRQQFATTIHLIHPMEGPDFSIYTHASKNAIGAVLIQSDGHGESHVISTASRVVTPKQHKYTTCEQELLAIVYALQKFIIYFFSHHIEVHTDSKALSFLKRCTLTSNRMARWIMALQGYDIEIAHISGTENYFADSLSRNPAGLTPEQISSLTKPRELLIAALKLNGDGGVTRELKLLAQHQASDPELQAIRKQASAGDPSSSGRCLLHQDILYRKDEKGHQYWRAGIPTNLCNDLINLFTKPMDTQGWISACPLSPMHSI